jgi:hypothetical protein
VPFPILVLKARAVGVDLESVTAACSAPASVATTFVGQTGLPPVGVRATITETLGTTATSVPGIKPPLSVSVPAIAGSASSSGSNVFDEIIAGLFAPVFLLEATLLTLTTTAGVIVVTGAASAVAASLFASMPPSIPVRSTEAFKAINASNHFPVVFLNWKKFGATSSAIVATGNISIGARDQSEVALTIAGPRTITGQEHDLAGGVDETYSFNLVNLVPDDDKFMWRVDGAAIDGNTFTGPISRDSSLSVRGQFTVTFPLPLDIETGSYPVTLTVTATETDGANKLAKSASIVVTVVVTTDTGR